MKKLFTIPADAPFTDALAAGLMREYGNDPAKLSDLLILLPTRRSCLHLREAFRKHMRGKAVLLPRMQPIGDIDEEELYFAADINPDIPPAIAPLRRQLLLTRLIKQKNEDMPLDQAAKLAEALARLLDEVQTERRDFKNIGDLVADKELAKHWQDTVEFLKILTESWPLILADEGALDPAERRNRVLEAQAAAWKTKSPNHPIIAAGSTGSMPATADLLSVIAGLPQGSVILPGLDQALPEEAWQAIGDTHPQYGMKQLLEKFGAQRSDVKIWNASPSPRAARVRLLQESMLPAEVSEAWRDLDPKAVPRTAVGGMQHIELEHPQEEAQAIALIMRSTLEEQGKAAALVTPDRALAERVSNLLGRWNIKVNDSAGISLAQLPTGGFLIDALRAADPHATPIDMLALLKHPLTACGLSLAECRARARRIEVDIWRKQKPDEKSREAEGWLKTFKQLLKPVADSWRKGMPLIERIKAHIALAESLAASNEQKGAERLWKGEEGEAASTWLDEWRGAARDFPSLNGAEYAELFMGLARGVTVRSEWGLHPRLSILGPLEARLIHADRMILGGLNEGIWPPEAPADPWMSRPMKKDFALPLPERRIGLSAHDFVQLASANEVFLTRSRRTEGAPSVPSRFLMQLEAVLRALGYSSEKVSALAPAEPWQAWAQALDEPAAIVPCEPPEPMPPVKLRPTELSVTEIGTWRRNPYAIYAKHILGLRKLDPLEADPDAADRGNMIHEALDIFIKTYPRDLPKKPLDALLAIGQTIFAAYAEHPEVRAFWWPRFERIAAWFVDAEQTRRAEGIYPLQAEAKGRITIGGLTLKGRADRIDRMPDGTLAIGDYKTGAVPTDTIIAAGYEPQLPLLALIAAEGGFEGIGAADVSRLAHWKLNGGRGGSDIRDVKDGTALTEKAREGLEQLIKAFADPKMPYRAVPKPELQPRYDDYAHLARLQEWGRTEDDA